MNKNILADRVLIQILTFGFGNDKLSNAIATFSLPAGHTCPFAKACFCKSDKITGKLTDGKDMEFRCFAASQEAAYSNVRRSRWYNFELLKQKQESIQSMANLIQRSLPNGYLIIRIHVSGDFFSEKYFLAWLNVAINNPYIVFYGYTKALPFFVKYKKHIPSNFRFTASYGGTTDNLISKHHMKYAKVVFSVEDAAKENLGIDHDDSLAIAGRESFGLLLHGYQKPNSLAAKALIALKKQGIGVYNKETKKSHANQKAVKIYVPVLSVKSVSAMKFNQTYAN